MENLILHDILSSLLKNTLRAAISTGVALVQDVCSQSGRFAIFTIPVKRSFNPQWHWPRQALA